MNTTKEALEPCPLAHEVREGVNLWSSSAGQKWHIWCYDCGLQFEGRLNQLKDEVIKAWNLRPAPIAPVVDGISWTALLSVLERLKSKTRNPDAEWYHGWNAAIQCLVNDINARSAAPASPAALR